MMDQPSAASLIEAVRTFLETKAIPELKGHTAFHARVAANALAIVARELEHGPGAAQDEVLRLRTILGRDGDLNQLNRELCRRIRDSSISWDNQELADHLTRSTIAKVAIDQPGYSGFKTATGSNGA
jgi:hypothetical protein